MYYLRLDHAITVNLSIINFVYVVYHGWTESGSEEDSKVCTDPHSSYEGAGCDEFEPDDMEFESK